MDEVSRTTRRALLVAAAGSTALVAARAASAGGTAVREGAAVMTEERVWQFVAAWQRRDLEAVMSFIAEDCEFVTTSGPEPGTAFRGKAAIREVFRAALEAPDDGSDLQLGPLLLSGKRAALEWSERAPGTDGTPMRMRGVDLYEFEGGLISRKDVFRKVFA